MEMPRGFMPDLPQPEVAPKSPEKNELVPESAAAAKALSILESLRPDLSPEEQKKRAQAFEQKLQDKNIPSDVRDLMLSAPVRSLEDAKTLSQILTTSTKENLRTNLQKYSESRPNFENPLSDASNTEIDSALTGLNEQSVRNFLGGTDQEYENLFKNLDEQLTERSYMENPSIPHTEKRRAMNELLSDWRPLLKDAKATLFASTAMFLQGEKLRAAGIPENQIPKEFQKIPGDLDIAVPTRKELLDLVNKLTRAGAEFKTDNLKQLADGTLAIEGSLPLQVTIDGKPELMRHEFEIFTSDTNRILKGAIDKTEQVQGFTILSPEGLQKQYANNAELESRAQAQYEKVRNFLNLIGNRALTPEESEKIGLSQEDVETFHNLQANYWRQTQSGDKKSADQSAEGIMRLITGGYKSKAAKRIQSAEAVQNIQSINIDATNKPTTSQSKRAANTPQNPFAKAA